MRGVFQKFQGFWGPWSSLDVTQFPPPLPCLFSLGQWAPSLWGPSLYLQTKWFANISDEDMNLELQLGKEILLRKAVGKICQLLKYRCDGKRWQGLVSCVKEVWFEHWGFHTNNSSHIYRRREIPKFMTLKRRSQFFMMGSITRWVCEKKKNCTGENGDILHSLWPEPEISELNLCARCKLEKELQKVVKVLSEKLQEYFKIWIIHNKLFRKFNLYN